MALRGNGQLLLRVAARSGPAAMLAAPRGTLLRGYTLKPLSPARSPAVAAAAGVAAAVVPPTQQWLLATPAASGQDASPWDTAHAAAQATGYDHFVEPDILHERDTPPPAQLDGGLNPDWPPTGDAISPGWHLEPDWTGFAAVRGTATGTGIRIAHLDTGNWPAHVSTPRRLRPDLGWDFWNNQQSTVDPGSPGILVMPGHGTATLALLAGSTMNLTLGTGHYEGDVGGAPDAEVVPVRIGPSVIHLCTSTMAQGLYYAMAPSGDPAHPNPANRCDVVSISHGGLPSVAWAAAINAVYEAGIVVVAASGDSIFLEVMDIATRYTVYPAAFNRVITAVGATYDKKPYITTKFGDLQGCWGPDTVMQKAIAAFTPNVPWMKFETTDGFDMSGGGTSASTPQVAAACALWLQLFGNRLAADWHRVEACRLALFGGADDKNPDISELGRGLLNVTAMLDSGLAGRAIAAVANGTAKMSAADSVSFPFWRLLIGLAPPDSVQEEMYQAEVAQVVAGSKNPALRAAARDAASATPAAIDDATRAKYRDMLAGEGISVALKQRLGAA